MWYGVSWGGEGAAGTHDEHGLPLLARERVVERRHAAGRATVSVATDLSFADHISAISDKKLMFVIRGLKVYLGFLSQILRGNTIHINMDPYLL